MSACTLYEISNIRRKCTGTDNGRNLLNIFRYDWVPSWKIFDKNPFPVTFFFPSLYVDRLTIVGVYCCSYVC